MPLWMKMCSGNSSDQKQFALSMTEFKKQLQFESLMVADSAFYTQENLQITSDIKWLSRVPLKVKAATELAFSVDNKELTKSQTVGYSYQEISKTYAAVKQRWLLVESEQRRESDLKKVEKNIKKDLEASQKKLRELSRQNFACTADALKAASRLLKKSKYHELIDIKTSKVKPSKTTAESKYKVEATVAICEEKVALAQRSAGRFVLATNVLNNSELTPEEMLCKYKEQQSVERGFSFLKDPMFLTDSVFLKSAKRIESLGLIMGLCLLVYTLGQRQLRQTLKRLKTGVKNQLGRLTDRPTLRWIFQCFQSVHVFFIEGVKQVSNLTDERLNLLTFFPKPCQAYYLLV